jgi:hypothetical protein
MTPMIDVVFQLMSFFMCTLKIVAPEGDFDIRMPLGKSAATASRRPAGAADPREAVGRPRRRRLPESDERQPRCRLR